MLMITIYIMARVKNLPKGDWQGWDEVAAAVLDAAFGLVLIVIILGGIYGGIFTPTEAAAVACVYAFFAALMIYRDMGPLQGRGWLRECEQRAFGLGLRVVAFAVIGFVLHASLGKAGVYPEGWGLAVAIGWVLVCLGTGWAMTHFAAQRSRVAWPVIVMLGALPGVIFAYWTMVSIFQGLSGFASGSMLAFAGTGLLAVLAGVFLLRGHRGASYNFHVFAAWRGPRGAGHWIWPQSFRWGQGHEPGCHGSDHLFASRGCA
jgi:C4-dicarboxylate transporter DctM subunit